MSETIASIVEKFQMTFDSDKHSDPDSFFHWVLKHPHHVGGHLARSWAAIQAVLYIYEADEISSVAEYFGGMGAHALMAEHLFSPSEHSVVDFSAEACRHLDVTLPAHVDIINGDAYAPENFRHADLVLFDCGDLTAWKTRPGEKVHTTLERIFAAGPKAVVLTDIAAPRLHLQAKRYETLLGAGTCANNETYLAAFCEHLRREFGYQLVEGYYDRWSSVFCMVPEIFGPETTGSFLPTPASPVGLELF